MIRVAWSVALAGLLAQSLPADADQGRAALLDHLGGQGCVIGPATRPAALKAGFSAAALDALADEAVASGQGEVQRDWLVLAPALCTIRPSQITPALRLDDPDVRRHFSARDAHAADDAPGCFLDSANLMRETRITRGWSADIANAEYMRLVGAGLISGEMTFYSDTPLATPVGFALLTGDCADIPDIGAIRQDHALLIDRFDPLVRAMGRETVCEKGGTPDIFEVEKALAAMPGDKTSNAWQWLEILMIAMASDWYEGGSATEKGTPHPPFCHFE